MGLLEVKRIEAPASLSEMAYETLKESLLKMDVAHLPEEGRLDERALSSSLGISRTPLREAINRLVTEGFLKIVPRKGVFVVKKTKKEILEILLVSAALEGMAARLAAKKVNDLDLRRLKDLFAPFTPENIDRQALKYSEAHVEFHSLILALSQCGKLIELANHLYDHIRWVRFRATHFTERRAQSLAEHSAIIEALERRDPDAAARLMRSHVENLAAYIEEKPDLEV